jgi:hypothetical protein
MTIDADSKEDQRTTEDLLMEIVEELKLLNARIEEAFETGIEEID